MKKLKLLTSLTSIGVLATVAPIVVTSCSKDDEKQDEYTFGTPMTLPGAGATTTFANGVWEIKQGTANSSLTYPSPVEEWASNKNFNAYYVSADGTSTEIENGKTVNGVTFDAGQEGLKVFEVSFNYDHTLTEGTPEGAYIKLVYHDDKGQGSTRFTIKINQ